MKHEVENGYYSFHVMNFSIEGKSYGNQNVWQSCECDVLYTFKETVTEIQSYMENHEKFRCHYINLEAGIILDVTGIVQDEIDARNEDRKEFKGAMAAYYQEQEDRMMERGL